MSDRDKPAFTGCRAWAVLEPGATDLPRTYEGNRLFIYADLESARQAAHASLWPVKRVRIVVDEP